MSVEAKKKISFGFDFPGNAASPEVQARISNARARLRDYGFDIPSMDDIQFEAVVRRELLAIPTNCRAHIVADISSMSRSRIAALLLAFWDLPWPAGCDLDVAYFPCSYATHKHRYEPLEHFGPCHGRIAGWPDDPDLPSSLLIGLGTEPGRADGVVEMLEPDILAVYVPLGDDNAYLQEVQRENRRVLEVGGQPVLYTLRNPLSTYGSLLATAQQLASRSRLVIVPLGPKIFCVMSIAIAMTLGPSVGVWKASAGRGVQPVDVASAGPPILIRIAFTASD